MKEAFVEVNFKADTLRVIEQANEIVEAYERQGYQLTLRQLYYQFVARALIENTERSYKRLGSIINDGRMAGLIDWEAIEDRTRNLAGNTWWTSPAQIIRASHYSFQLDRWANQPRRVECWVEKEALVGVIARVCQQYDVNYFACRGYVSQSEMYAAAQRLKDYIDEGQEVVILHLGDHDPSGIDMTRDIEARLQTFLYGPFDHEIDRLALNWNQIERYAPPPNPAKMTDSRFEGYQREYGNESWELDALQPQVIADLVEASIIENRDHDKWMERLEEEAVHKRLLERTSREWNKVVEFLERGGND